MKTLIAIVTTALATSAIATWVDSSPPLPPRKATCSFTVSWEPTMLEAPMLHMHSDDNPKCVASERYVTAIVLLNFIRYDDAEPMPKPFPTPVPKPLVQDGGY